MLRLNALRAGDVILTRGLEKMSTAIAHLSDGEFSHAALCTAANIVFESDGGLVGFKVLENLGWTKTIHGEGQLGRLPDAAKNCAVYRHPKMQSVSADRFAAVLEQEMLESFGKHYSEMFRLIRLANINDSAKHLVGSFLRLHHRWYLKDNIPGPFCSELVARFYKRLDLPLFQSGKLPDQISPNDLTRSLLIRVNDAVLTRDQLIDPPSQLLGTEDFDLKANRLSTAITEQMSEERQWGKILEDAKKDAPAAEVSPSDVLAMVTGSFQRLISDVSERFDVWQASGISGDTRRAHRVGRLAVGLLAQWPEIMSSEGDEFDKYAIASRASGVLRRSLLRTATLHAIGQLKLRRQKEGFWARRRTDQERRRAARSCRFANSLSLSFEKEWTETEKVAAKILQIGDKLVEGLPSSGA